MPLHLLGKKSWNVYNTENIEKVKRDERAAAAHEADEEKRLQEADAEHRIQILRGTPGEIRPIQKSQNSLVNQAREEERPLRERKRRRIAGEDDTERDMRYARESQTLTTTKREGEDPIRKGTINAPLTDRAGHINLFPSRGSRCHVSKNPEAEAEIAKKKREYENQYTMRFENAAGFKQSLGREPWYHSSSRPENEEESLSKDAWGDKNPRRKERQKSKIAAEDPLAAIQKGVQSLRELEKQRKTWKQEQDREMKQLERAARGKRKRKMRFTDGAKLDIVPLDNAMNDDGHSGHHKSHGGKESDQRHGKIRGGQRSSRIEDQHVHRGLTK